MGKHGGSMTAAAISKRMKAKGLGRLRWYCQMCEKQCRDDNGFKNHTQSAGHERQLALFSENPTRYISRFSDTFRKEFLLVLRRRYGTSMVSANTVYQEYIKDKDHLHMNATKWTTLSEFAKELGREGFCTVQDREDGWFLAFIDRAAAEKERRAREMDRKMLAQEQRAENLLLQKLKVAKESKARQVNEEDPKKNSPLADVEIPPIQLHGKQIVDSEPENWDLEENPLEVLSSKRTPPSDLEDAGRTEKKRRRRWQDAPKLPAIEQIMRSEQGTKCAERKQKMSSNVTEGAPESQTNAEEAQPWIMEGIAVKVTNEKVGDGAFYRKKGAISKVIEGYGARVQIFNSSTILELDQDDLETVIPKPGGEVVLLRSPRRGQRATVQSINIETYSVNITLGSGEELENVDYEAVSRPA